MLSFVSLGLAVSLVLPSVSLPTVPNTPATVVLRLLPHAKLKSSLPAAGASVAAPKELRLTFSEGLELKMSRVSLWQGTTDTHALGELTADGGETLVARVVKPLAKGTYTVKFTVAGEDGHPMSGSFTFMIQ
ncbi:MAG: copper resistance protein CopC [Gemmatimonadetes bacterium]|nr:copper resistance protein CopC [Gemmatimonadota bacterium]